MGFKNNWITVTAACIVICLCFPLMVFGAGKFIVTPKIAAGWQVDSNIVDGVFYPQHQSYAERETVAQTCGLNLNITLPILIEEMDNTVDQAYGAAPERLYLIGTDGRVVYKGGAGPFFFDLDEWEQAIETCLMSAEAG